MRNIKNIQAESANVRNALAENLRKATDTTLSDEARLRLYEKFNEERVRRGETLISIPADLLARVKSRAAATPDAAKLAAAGGKESVALAAASSVHFA
jgi:hypothetical protein